MNVVGGVCSCDVTTRIIPKLKDFQGLQWKEVLDFIALALK